jgi:hypothetical protein
MHTKFKSENPKGRYRSEDNIRMDLWVIGWEVVKWIHLAQNGDQWRALVNTVNKLDEVFSGYQLCQVYVRNRHIRSLMMMMIEMVLETSVSYIHLTQLIARENLIEFSCHESSKS